MPRMTWLSAIIACVLVAAGAAAIAFAQRAGSGAGTGGAVMTPAEAHARAMKGEIVLVDIRTPQEWRETGIPASAHAITMNQDGRALMAALDKAMGSDRSKPLAIICRTGNRSSMLAPQLKAQGFGNVIDVAEGLAGGRNGPGWLKAGLPLRPASASGPVLAAQ